MLSLRHFALWNSNLLGCLIITGEGTYRIKSPSIEVGRRGNKVPNAKILFAQTVLTQQAQPLERRIRSPNYRASILCIDIARVSKRAELLQMLEQTTRGHCGFL